MELLLIDGLQISLLIIDRGQRDGVKGKFKNISQKKISGSLGPHLKQTKEN